MRLYYHDIRDELRAEVYDWRAHILLYNIHMERLSHAAVYRSALITSLTDVANVSARPSYISRQ